MNLEFVEKSALGTCLKENYLILDSGLTTEYFTSALHKMIFSAMTELAHQNKSVDFATLMTVRNPEEIGGANYLMDLMSCANPDKFDDYFAIIKENWQEIEKHRILVQAQQGDWSIADITKAFDLLESNDTQNDMSLKNTLLKLANLPFEKPSEQDTISTNLRDLDAMLGGLYNGDLIIVAGRPSMGKTDVMNHIALEAGWSNALPIIFSEEMSTELIAKRLLGSGGGFNRTRIRDAYNLFTEDEKEKWVKTIAAVDKANIHIDDRAYLKVSQMRASARKVIQQNPDLRPIILVDYLQITQPDNPKANPVTQMGQISRDLKRMAKEFNCPVVALSQLSRSVEQRQDKRPMMSDLRDSGNLEQDADVICFLYREDYYDKETEDANSLEIIISKQRNGPTGAVKVAYRKTTGRLININWGQVQ